jgi:hypothetical protein
MIRITIFRALQCDRSIDLAYCAKSARVVNNTQRKFFSGSDSILFTRHSRGNVHFQ